MAISTPISTNQRARPSLNPQDNGEAVHVEDEPQNSNAPTTTLRYVENPTLLSTERTSIQRPQLRDHAPRSHDAKRASTTLAAQEIRGEVASLHSQGRFQSHPGDVENYDQGTTRREGSNKIPGSSEDTITHKRASKNDRAAKVVGEKVVHGRENHHGYEESGKFMEPSVKHLAQTQTARYSFQTADPERDSTAKESLSGGGGTAGGGEAAWPPSPPSFSDGFGTESYSPQRHHDASQERRDRARVSSLNYRSLTFVERQEIEQLAAEHRHEELLRAEEEARRELASGGSWMNLTSRAILARSSSLRCGGGGGRSSSSQPGTRGRRHEPSVFERLARRAADHDGTSNEEWTRETWDGGNGDGRQPFTPTINARSSLLAPRVLHRDDGGCPQQRLYRDGEERLRRRERRVQLADRALRERSVSCHVNPESERVLARRNRSRAIKFQSKMLEVLEVNQ